MNIPNQYFIVVDIVIVAIFILCFIFSYKNGILYEFVSLFSLVISIFLGYFLSPIAAKWNYLITPNLDNANILNLDAIYYSINVVLWFLIIAVAFIIIFMIIKPLFKKLTKIPVVGWANKIFGLVFGFIKGLVICFLLSCALSSSTLIKNASEVKNGTIIKYVDTFSNFAIKTIVKNIDYKELDENISDIDIEQTRKIFEEWLIKQGFINDQL